MFLSLYTMRTGSKCSQNLWQVAQILLAVTLTVLPPCHYYFSKLFLFIYFANECLCKTNIKFEKYYHAQDTTN